jgi:penicillin-binding protein 1B
MTVVERPASGEALPSRAKQSKQAGNRGRGRKRKQARRRWLTPRRLRVAGLLFAVVAFVVGLRAADRVVELDRIVVERFEGRQFTVPSRVLSAPTILYPGVDARHTDLRGTLLRLGYREQPGQGPPRPGRFRWEVGRLRVHLRAFDHPMRPEPDRDLVIRFDGHTIAEIRQLPGSRELGAVLLEPEPVGSYFGPNREQRELVRLREVPEHLLGAILSVEDRRFETHHGIDPRRIVGALIANLKAGGIRQGGSTLTQQLVKNFFLTPERTLSRKLQEATMALLVEARYGKEAILESYLNEIYLGQRGSTAVHGVGQASQFFFGKPATELSLSESALLAAIIQSPSRMSPRRHPEGAIERRNLVLELMLKQGRIDAQACAEAQAEPLQIAAVMPLPSEARYFLDLLRRQLPEFYDAELLSEEGMRIYSTLDPRLQRAAAAALREGLDEVEKRKPDLVGEGGAGLQGCVISLRPQTGEILALVGGRDYGVSQFDRCTQARRHAGSTFKPFVYIAALEPRAGGRPLITLASQLEDLPLEVQTNAGIWKPKNYDRTFRGPVPVRTALEGSLNVPAAKLALAVGIDRVIDVARRLGITSPMPEVPSLALGTADVSPLEIARAYATLANGGVRTLPHAFEDLVAADGRVLERGELRLENVLAPEVAFLATSLLEGVTNSGTARRVRALGLRGPVASKTGTSDEERDLWFVGYTPELVTVVWVGFDEPRSVGVASSSLALPIWTRFMLQATGEEVRGLFLPPPGVRRVEVASDHEAIALRGCPEHRPEFFLAGTEPTETCPRGRPLPRRSGEDDPKGKERRGPLEWFRDLF